MVEALSSRALPQRRRKLDDYRQKIEPTFDALSERRDAPQSFKLRHVRRPSPNASEGSRSESQAASRQQCSAYPAGSGRVIRAPLRSGHGHCRSYEQESEGGHQTMDQLPDWVAIALPVVIAIAVGFGLLEGSLRWWSRRMERSYAAEHEADEAARPKR